MRQLFRSIIFFGSIALASCQSVKPYQKVYLNDQAMQSDMGGASRFERSVQIYREGASGGGSSKSSGGCGCN